MLHSLYVLFQLDEARKYLEDGRPERLRLALLLLDNAAEIQLNRQITADLEYEKIREKLRSRWLEIPEAKRSGVEVYDLDRPPLTPSERKRIDRYFGEKVSYLAKQMRRFDSRLIEPLKYLHNYRNEAYHAALVRPETIRTAAILLLEINCQLLLVLPETMCSYSPDEDYSWLKERFDMDGGKLFGQRETLLQKITDEIRVKILPSDEGVGTALTDHLESRFGELYDLLDSLVSDLSIPDRAVVLKCSQYFHTTGDSRFDSVNFGAFQAKYGVGFVEQLKKRIPVIRKASDRMDAFYKFSLIERELEPIERTVNSLRRAADNSIQMAVDIALGK